MISFPVLTPFLSPSLPGRGQVGFHRTLAAPPHLGTCFHATNVFGVFSDRFALHLSTSIDLRRMRTRQERGQFALVKPLRGFLYQGPRINAKHLPVPSVVPAGLFRADKILLEKAMGGHWKQDGNDVRVTESSDYPSGMETREITVQLPDGRTGHATVQPSQIEQGIDRATDRAHQK